jgi:hypothetical protein
MESRSARRQDENYSSRHRRARFFSVGCDRRNYLGPGGWRSGGSGKGSWLSIVLLPFFIIYSAILTHQVRKKSKACKELLARLEKLDPAWDLDAINHRVNEVFFKVQRAWMERNQDLAKDCLSDGIFQKHKLQTDQMIAQRRKNMLENINLTQVDIVDV